MSSPEIKCRCAQPVIIVNPKLKQYIYSINILHLSTNVEHYRICSFDSLRKRLSRVKYKNDLNYTSYSDYYVVTNDGEIIPCYILVPCNKCFICRDKLSQQWQFRGIAETNSSRYKTYFITLTYNNNYLPYDGVSVKAIQLFMKRLRNNLDKLGIEHNLKYYACGEYGSNTHRPHYHLILWHFPDTNFNNLHDVLEFIKKSWSVYDFIEQKHEEIGYCYVKPCNSGTLKYVMKYARKSGITPIGKNPFFTCCSKYIGLQWYFDNYDYINKHPDVLSVSINDNSQQQLFTSPFPQYYKNKLMPNFSTIFPKEVMQSLEYCLYLHTEISTIKNIIPIKYEVPEILNKYFQIIYDNRNYLLYNRDIDDCTYYRYSHSCPFTLNQMAIKKIMQLQPYLVLLDSYYYKNINIFNSSNKLRTKREISIQNKQFEDITLDMMRIENEKLQRWRINEIKREFF